MPSSNPLPHDARHRPRGAAFLVAIAALAIAAATLTPTVPSDSYASPWCVICGPSGTTDAVANVLLFVPLGAALALSGVRVRWALAAVALTTLAIEVVQWRLVTGRDASLGDLLANAVGGAAGFWVARRGAKVLVAPRPGTAATLAALWTLCWLGGAVLTAWALVPAPPAQRWWVYLSTEQRAPASTLTLADASLGSLPLADGRPPNQDALRSRLLAGGELVVRAVRRAPTPRSANLVNVEDGQADVDVFTLTKTEGRFVYRVRTRAERLRLRSPVVAVREGPAPAASDTVQVVGVLDRQRLAVSIEDRRGCREQALALGPNVGWLLLAPVEYVADRGARLLTALWVLALALPVGYWAARALGGGSAGGRLAGWALLVAPGPGLALVARAFGTAPMHWSEWAGWLCGTAVGAAVSGGLPARARSREERGTRREPPSPVVLSAPCPSSSGAADSPS